VTNREFAHLMKRVKDAPELGGGFSRSQKDAGWQRICDRLGFDAAASAQPVQATWKDYVAYYKHRYAELFARPFAISASAFALVFGGWVATVNASFDSLPGDILYPVKLATERMQITLATSDDQRARLHAEFAARRLQEAGAISSSNRPDRGVELKAAVDGFKAELASANEQLAALGAGNPSQAVDLAVTLDQKTDEYHAILTQTAPVAATTEEKAEVADAQQAVEQVDTTAIDTLVSANESGDGAQTKDAIEKNFQQTLTDVRTRVALSSARLTALQKALQGANVSDADLDSRIAAARQAATSHEKDIDKAMDDFAAGGFRSAFDKLDGVSTVLDRVEEQITAIEIDVSTRLAPDAGPASF
jgi:hypothetical protein